MTTPPRPRAMAPKCDWYDCFDIAVVANFWRKSDHTVTHNSRFCGRHHEEALTHKYWFDRYEPLLLAYIGDELWTALECWLETMHRLLYEPSDHRPKRREVKKHWHVWFNAGNGIARCPCGEEDASFAVGNMRHGLLLLRQETP